MKITKTKEVEKIIEEIEISTGTYYFEDEQLISYKMVLTESDEPEFLDYKLETVKNFGNMFGITIQEDWMDSFNVPYRFENFILGKSGKKIEQKEYEEEREHVLNKISK